MKSSTQKPNSTSMYRAVETFNVFLRYCEYIALAVYVFVIIWFWSKIECSESYCSIGSFGEESILQITRVLFICFGLLISLRTLFAYLKKAFSLEAKLTNQRFSKTNAHGNQGPISSQLRAEQEKTMRQNLNPDEDDDDVIDFNNIYWISFISQSLTFVFIGLFIDQILIRTQAGFLSSPVLFVIVIAIGVSLVTLTFSKEFWESSISFVRLRLTAVLLLQIALFMNPVLGFLASFVILPLIILFRENPKSETFSKH